MRSPGTALAHWISFDMAQEEGPERHSMGMVGSLPSFVVMALVGFLVALVL